jgi:hypothetical protein
MEASASHLEKAVAAPVSDPPQACGGLPGWNNPRVRGVATEDPGDRYPKDFLCRRRIWQLFLFLRLA